MWNLPTPPGFQGLYPDMPVTIYHRHLPHWRQDGATYFVTFRLADSLPQSKLDELATLKKEWERHLRHLGGTRGAKTCPARFTTGSNAGWIREWVVVP